jgi:hypothetical protein
MSYQCTRLNSKEFLVFDGMGRPVPKQPGTNRRVTSTGVQLPPDDKLKCTWESQHSLCSRQTPRQCQVLNPFCQNYVRDDIQRCRRRDQFVKLYNWLSPQSQVPLLSATPIPPASSPMPTRSPSLPREPVPERSAQVKQTDPRAQSTATTPERPDSRLSPAALLSNEPNGSLPLPARRTTPRALPISGAQSAPLQATVSLKEQQLSPETVSYQLQAAQAEIVRLQNYIAGRENMLTELFEETRQLWDMQTERYDNLQEDYADLQAKYDKVLRAERIAANQLKQVSLMQNTRDEIIAELKNTVQYYRDLAKSFEQEIARMKGVIQEQGQSLVDLNNEYTQTQIVELQKTKRIVEASRAALVRAEGEIAELQKQLRQNPDITENVTKLQRENRRLQEQIQQLKDESLDLQESSEQLLREQYNTIQRLQLDLGNRGRGV